MVRLARQEKEELREMESCTRSITPNNNLYFPTPACSHTIRGGHVPL